MFAEYIWIDAQRQLRGKTRYINSMMPPTTYPDWSFDGSSTGNASTEDSDVILNPVYSVFGGPVLVDALGVEAIVLCDIEGSSRSRLSELLTEEINESYCQFGLEQEYFFQPHGDDNVVAEMGEQGPYYCGVGTDREGDRPIVIEHMRLLERLGMGISGVNAEVAPNQWEFQIGPLGPLEVADQLWVARYILERLAENAYYGVDWHPKPYSGDWNGSGCHANFSTEEMRSLADQTLCHEVAERLGSIDVRLAYGEDNDMRLTGLHETAPIDEFSVGLSHRGASVRIHPSLQYIEDRRPASNCDPYTVVYSILEAVFSGV